MAETRRFSWGRAIALAAAVVMAGILAAGQGAAQHYGTQYLQKPVAQGYGQGYAQGYGAMQGQGAVVQGAPQRSVIGERYAPTIWVDPDGCEHWVMDDGVEGYMTPHVTRQGIPVCRRANVCGVMSADQFFATDSYRINHANQNRLAQFFASTGATAYIIVGHTDSRASDSYNMRLSYNRANAVARIAAGVGARIADVRGMGERTPVAPNNTAAGMAQNRRVEIICIR